MTRTPLLTYSVAPGSSPAGGLLEGTLGVAPNAPCIQMLVPGHDPIGLLWPAGYSATFDPLRIYDAAGAEVASAGHIVTLGGDMVFEPNDACKTSASFLVLGVTDATVPPAN